MTRPVALTAAALLALAAPPGLCGCGLFVSSHQDVGKYTKVFAAADACDTATVRQYVEASPRLVKQTEWENATLLHRAALKACPEEAAWLLDHGADPNARETDGVTPLHLAAEAGSQPVVETLLQHGADIDAVDAKGWTPLDRATKWRHPDIAAYLAAHGGHSGQAH